MPGKKKDGDEFSAFFGWRSKVVLATTTANHHHHYRHHRTSPHHHHYHNNHHYSHHLTIIKDTGWPFKGGEGEKKRRGRGSGGLVGETELDRQRQRGRQGGRGEEEGEGEKGVQDAGQQVVDYQDDEHLLPQAGGPDEQVEGGGHRGRGAAQCEEAISREDG